MKKISLIFSYRDKNKKVRSTDTTYSYFGSTSAYLKGDFKMDGKLDCSQVNSILNGQARSLMPNDFPISGSPNIVNSGNDTQDAILSFETGDRNYKWRFRARGNGAGAELYLEYYKADGEWGVAQRWPSSSGYKDAEGGTP